MAIVLIIKDKKTGEIITFDEPGIGSLAWSLDCFDGDDDGFELLDAHIKPVYEMSVK